MTNTEASKMVKAFAAKLSEEGFNVQVFLMRQDGKSLDTMTYGCGNVLARRELARVWVKQQEDYDLLSTYRDEDEPQMGSFREVEPYDE